MSRISIEVTPDIHKAVKMAALDSGLSVKEYVIHKLMDGHSHKKAKSGAGHDDCPLCRAYGNNREYNARTLKSLDKSIDDIKNNRGIKRYKNVEKAIEYLRS